jgi:hypothetical protein
MHFTRAHTDEIGIDFRLRKLRKRAQFKMEPWGQEVIGRKTDDGEVRLPQSGKHMFAMVNPLSRSSAKNVSKSGRRFDSISLSALATIRLLSPEKLRKRDLFFPFILAVASVSISGVNPPGSETIPVAKSLPSINLDRPRQPR